jgi:hypothetical protein
MQSHTFQYPKVTPVPPTAPKPKPSGAGAAHR